MAKKNYVVGLLITGDGKKGVKATQVTRDGLKSLSAQQKKTAKSTSLLMQKSGALIGKLGKVSSLVGLATTALGGMGVMMRTKAITEMKVMADTLNLSTQTLSEWTTAGEKFNVSGDKMADIFKDLQDKIGDFAATGGGEAKDVFEKLNLDIGQFMGLSADQQLLKIGEALDGVASHNKKIFFLEALANDASRLLPLLENSAAGLKAAQHEARLLGTSISDIDAEMISIAEREFQRTKDVVTGLGNVLTAKLAPALAGMNNGIADIVIGFGGWEKIVGTVIDYMLQGIDFVLEHLKPLHVTLLTAQLGWQMIGKAATSAMASTAKITADVINRMLKPFQVLLWGIAEGWGRILIGVGKFTGDSGLTKLGKSLQGFAKNVAVFSVSADDIVAADVAMGQSLANTKAAIEAAKKATYGGGLSEWFKQTTEAAEENAKAIVKVKKEQRALGLETAKTQQLLFGYKQLSEIDKLVKGVNQYSTTWASAGGVIIDTFGSIAQQLDKLEKSQRSYGEELVNIAKLKVKYAQDPAELAKLASYEEKLTKTRTSANIASYKSMTNAAGQMFSEHSKGRKAMEAASNIFTAVELANSALRIGSYAIEAITAAFAAPWPIGFASGTAMIAIMAGLGVAVSGGSRAAPTSAATRQENQGTGTVLGDDSAKSQSLLNSYERIEDLQLDQYAELQEMNRSLRDLNSNIRHLARSLVARNGSFDASSYGGQLGSKNSTSGYLKSAFLGLTQIDPTGITTKILSTFSKTKKSLVDSGIKIVSQTLGEIIDSGLVQAQAYYDTKTKKTSWWGLTSKTSYKTDYQAIDQTFQHELALIFSSINTSIGASLEVLGVDVNRSLENFVINVANMSFKDLSGAEIEAELQAIISHQADLMAHYLAPQMAKFQQVGEGLYATLIRVAQEQVIFNSQMEAVGHSLNHVADLSVEAQLAIAQSLIGLMGGLDNFKEATSTYFSEFFSEEEHFLFLQTSLKDVFVGLNESLPETREAFKTLLGGIDKTTDSGQALYATLLTIIGSLDQYYDVLEEGTAIAEAAAEKEIELAQARMAFNKNIQAQLNTLDMSPLEKALDTLNQQFMNDFKNALSLGADMQLLETFYGKQRTVVIEKYLGEASRSFESTIEGIATNLTNLVSVIGNTREGLTRAIQQIKRDMGGFDEVSLLTGNINGLYGQLGSGSIEDQLSVVDALNEKIVSRYALEFEQFNTLSTLSEERYQQELDQYSNIKRALSSLGSYASGLSLSNYSPLSGEQKFQVSQRQFSNDFVAAKHLDLDAIANITGSADAYLSEARNMFGSSGRFNAIFNRVQSSLEYLATITVEAPKIPSEVEVYQSSVLALQTHTITELQALNTELAVLETQARLDANNQTLLATEQYEGQVAIIEQTQALSQAQLDGQLLNNALVQQQLEQQQTSNELNAQQLAEQQKSYVELVEQNRLQNTTIAVLQQQLRELEEGNRNAQETNAHIVHNQRQA
ncbi:MAG: hypothetical protein HRT38_02715 [Alteromonadaceae bacterium]|nr:hypothetical protein [Alteromonadaceae bacterium]